MGDLKNLIKQSVEAFTESIVKQVQSNCDFQKTVLFNEIKYIENDCLFIEAGDTDLYVTLSEDDNLYYELSGDFKENDKINVDTAEDKKGFHVNISKKNNISYAMVSCGTVFNVKVPKVVNNIIVNSVAGNIRIDKLQLVQLSLNSKDGNISVFDAFSVNTEIITKNGDIKVNLLDLKKYNALCSSSSGNVVVKNYDKYHNNSENFLKCSSKNGDILLE